MKYLTKSTDIAYLYSLKGLLETNGIPAVIKGENTAQLITPFAMTEPSLWVYIDEQEDEAEKLILDPDYDVQGGIDVDEFYRLTKDVSENPKKLYESLLNLGIGIGLLSVLVIVLVALSGD
ncbi:MAG: DUF2007 domain-containing protein [Pseudomonadota bacterium]